MHRLMLSLGFGLLLSLSIAIKVRTDIGAGVLGMYPGDEDISAMLQRNGFDTGRAAPDTDPVWIYGVKDRCRIRIANVSPQGWHRSAVEWEAGGQALLYAASGRLYNRQPILKPMVIHYVRRLERYVGMDAPAVRVRAIIIGPDCPADAIVSSELAALS